MLSMEDIEQGTSSWRNARAGSVTGSCFKHVLAKLTKGKGEAASRRKYRLQLVAERITGVASEEFTAKQVAWGKEHENAARLAYEREYGVLVEQVGFVPHPEIEWVGVSPDGLVHAEHGVQGIVEIKCPYDINVHLDTYLRGHDRLAYALLGEEPPDGKHPIPPEHIPQVQGNMWVCDAEFCDFVSYDPRWPAHMRLYVHRVVRDDAYIENLKAEVLKFLGEVEDNVAKLLTPPAESEAGESTNSPQTVA